MSSFRLSHLGHLYTFPLGWATCMYMYILVLVKMYNIYTVPIWFRVVSALSLQEKPSGTDLQFVAESSAIGHWEGVCRRLGVSEDEIDQIQQDIPLNAKGAAARRFIRGLNYWFEGNSLLKGKKVPVTVAVLCKALEDSRCRGVSEELKQYYR